MDKQAIFQLVAQVEEQIGELYSELGRLKEQIVQLMEENTRLEMENERLRKMQKKSEENSSTAKGKKVAAESGKEDQDHNAMNHLANLYAEGFHICNLHYGRLRTDGECLFCISFLNKAEEEGT